MTLLTVYQEHSYYLKKGQILQTGIGFLPKQMITFGMFHTRLLLKCTFKQVSLVSSPAITRKYICKAVLRLFLKSATLLCVLINHFLELLTSWMYFISLLRDQKNLLNTSLLFPHFTDQEIEAQMIFLTCAFCQR